VANSSRVSQAQRQALLAGAPYDTANRSTARVFFSAAEVYDERGPGRGQRVPGLWLFTFHIFYSWSGGFGWGKGTGGKLGREWLGLEAQLASLLARCSYRWHAPLPGCPGPLSVALLVTPLLHRSPPRLPPAGCSNQDLALSKDESLTVVEYLLCELGGREADALGSFDHTVDRSRALLSPASFEGWPATAFGNRRAPAALRLLPAGPGGQHEGDWQHVSVLVCAEDEAIQQVGAESKRSARGGAPHSAGLGWHAQTPPWFERLLCLLCRLEKLRGLGLRPAMQAAYSQHSWWETRDCSQGQCPMEAGDDGELHPGDCPCSHPACCWP
jgi:hypothetical protein